MAEEHTHDHEHDHSDEDAFITLVDDQGNEELFEVLLTIDGMEEFGKNYVLVMPHGASEHPDEEVEISAFSFTQNEDGTAGDLNQIPEDSEDEWAMIEDVFGQWSEEHANDE